MYFSYACGSSAGTVTKFAQPSSLTYTVGISGLAACGKVPPAPPLSGGSAFLICFGVLGVLYFGGGTPPASPHPHPTLASPRLAVPARALPEDAQAREGGARGRARRRTEPKRPGQ